MPNKSVELNENKLPLHVSDGKVREGEAATAKARATPLDDSGTHPRLPDCCNMLQQGYYIDRETI